jgi:hypothetical protein
MPFLGTRTATPTCTAAASTLVGAALAGPVRPAAVVAAGSAAAYLDVGGDLVAVVAPGAVALPCAIVLAPGGEGVLAALVRSVDAGRRPLGLGGGAVWCGGEPVVTARRWFDPRVRVQSIDPGAVARLTATVGAVPPPDPAVPGTTPSTDLLGLGAGLTPSGDDLVAGYLAALRARCLPAADALGAEVRRLAPRRTTRLSAALLAAADRGAVLPEAGAVLRASAGDGDVEAATRRLLALGHTSGWYLAAGLAAGCAA